LEGLSSLSTQPLGPAGSLTHPLAEPASLALAARNPTNSTTAPRRTLMITPSRHSLAANLAQSRHSAQRADLADQEGLTCPRLAMARAASGEKAPSAGNVSRITQAPTVGNFHSRVHSTLFTTGRALTSPSRRMRLSRVPLSHRSRAASLRCPRSADSIIATSEARL